MKSAQTEFPELGSCGNSWLSIDMSSVSCEVMCVMSPCLPGLILQAGLMVLSPDNCQHHQHNRQDRKPQSELQRIEKIHFAIRINWLFFPSAISIWVLTPLTVWLAPHTAALPLCWVGSQVTESQIWQDSSRKCYWIIIWEPAAITTFCIDPTTVHLYCSCGPYITTNLGIQLIEETWILRCQFQCHQPLLA